MESGTGNGEGNDVQELVRLIRMAKIIAETNGAKFTAYLLEMALVDLREIEPDIKEDRLS